MHTYSKPYTHTHTHTHTMSQEYPTERDDGKVLNPSTDNWVTQGYADGRGFLEEAKEYTREHFKNKSDDQEFQEHGLDDVAEKFEDAGVPVNDLNDMMERAEESIQPHEDSSEDFNAMTEEEFMKSIEEEPQPQRGGDENFKGIYNSKSVPQTSERSSSSSSSQRRWNEERDGAEYRYVRTERGGMRKERIDGSDDNS